MSVGAGLGRPADIRDRDDPHVSAVRKTRAWDFPTRLFKWTLVILVANAFLSRYIIRDYGDMGLVVHMWNGLAIIVLLVFRLLWGIFGGTISRFSSFVTWPWRAVTYGLDLLRGRHRHYLGHNPLGGWVIITMLVLIAIQALSGLATSDDIVADGPLVGVVSAETQRWASVIHQNAFWLLLMVVPLHILANLFYTFVMKDNLIGAMFSGWKPRATFEDHQESRDGSPLVALVCLVMSIVIVFGGIWLAGGRPFPA